jgi:hypothetical protein
MEKYKLLSILNSVNLIKQYKRDNPKLDSQYMTAEILAVKLVVIQKDGSKLSCQQKCCYLKGLSKIALSSYLADHQMAFTYYLNDNNYVAVD